MSAVAIDRYYPLAMSSRDMLPIGHQELGHRQGHHLVDRYARTSVGERYPVDHSVLTGSRPSEDLIMHCPPYPPATTPTAPIFRAFDGSQARYSANPLPPPGPVPEQWPTMDVSKARHRVSTSMSVPMQASPMEYWYREDHGNAGSLPEKYFWAGEDNPSKSSLDSFYDDASTKSGASGARTNPKGHPQRRPSNRDEFDGPHQFLDRPLQRMPSPQEKDMPQLSTNLLVNEQDEVLNSVNDCLSRCAFNFVAKYQFPVPLESDKRPVKTPSDREWTEWVYLLKRLATKRRIPARVLYNGQIKQFVTVLENSLEMRHAAKHQSRPVKDDRNVLQLISAGLQVAKILKDPRAMEFLDHLYAQTEELINSRRTKVGFMA